MSRPGVVSFEQRLLEYLTNEQFVDLSSIMKELQMSPEAQESFLYQQRSHDQEGFRLATEDTWDIVLREYEGDIDEILKFIFQPDVSSLEEIRRLIGPDQGDESRKKVYKSILKNVYEKLVWEQIHKREPLAYSAQPDSTYQFFANYKIDEILGVFEERFRASEGDDNFLRDKEGSIISYFEEAIGDKKVAFDYEALIKGLHQKHKGLESNNYRLAMISGLASAIRGGRDMDDLSQAAKEAAEQAAREALAAKDAAEASKAASERAYRSLSEDMDDLRRSLGGRGGATPDPYAEALAKGEGNFTAADFKKLVAQNRVVNILVPSVVGGKTSVTMKAYGVPVFNYDGHEACGAFSSDVSSAISAWESVKIHNASSTYTSATDHQKKSLVSISKLTNRPLPNGDKEVYCVTTVTARGVSQSYISSAEYEAQIDKPLAKFYQASKKDLSEALQRGEVAVSNEKFIESVFKGVSAVDLTERADAFDKAMGKMKQTNLRNAEAKVDDALKASYVEIVNKVENLAEQNRILELINKGDYKAARASIADENGELKTGVFKAAEEAAAKGLWGDLQKRRNGVEDAVLDQKYKDIIALIIDPDQQGKADDFINVVGAGSSQNYEGLREYLLDAKGQLKESLFLDPADPTNTDLKAAKAKFEELEGLRNGAVGRMERHSENNYPAILKVLEEEKSRVENEMAAKKQDAENQARSDFLRDKYRGVINLMADVPSQKEMTEMLAKEGPEKVLQKLFEQSGNGFVNEMAFVPGGSTDFMTLQATYKNVGFAAKPTTDKAEFCKQVIQALDNTRPTRKEMLDLLQGGKFDEIENRLFSTPIPGLFDKIERDRVTGNVTSFAPDENREAAENLSAEAKDQFAMAGYVAAEVGRRLAKEQGKILSLSEGIDEIKDYQKRVLENKSPLTHVDPIDQKKVCDALRNNGLNEKFADEVARNNAVHYSEAYLEHKTQRSIERTTDAIALSPKVKKDLIDSYNKFSFTSNKGQEELAKTLNMELPLSSFGGISFLNKTQNQVSVVFNNVGNGGNDIAYIHIPGTNQAYLRARVCTEYNKEDPDFKDHKPGDVVIDYNKVFHRVAKMEKDGTAKIDINTGKPVTKYEAVDINSTREDLKIGAAKSVNLAREVVNISTIGMFGYFSSKFDSRSKGEQEFGLDDWQEVKKRLKNLHVLAVSVNENGERSVATMSNGEVLNHSARAGKKELGGVIDLDSDGKKIEFTFDKAGNLKGGNVDDILQSGGVTYYGNSRCIEEKGLKLGEVQFYGKVFAIGGEFANNSKLVSDRSGDVEYSKNMYYKNAAGKYEKVFQDPENGELKLEPDFEKFMKSGGQTFGAKEIQQIIAMQNERENGGVVVSIKTEAVEVKKFESGDDEWKDSGKKHQVSSSNLVARVERGCRVSACSDLKEDLLQIAANNVDDVSDSLNASRLSILQTAQQEIKTKEMNEGNRTWSEFFGGKDRHTIDELRPKSETSVRGVSTLQQVLRGMGGLSESPENRTSGRSAA